MAEAGLYPNLQTLPQYLKSSFEITHTFPDGTTKTGLFTVKKLSIKDLSRVQVRKVQLNGGMYYDESRPGMGIDNGTEWTNYVIAHLETALIQKPAWFNLDEIFDETLIFKVYEKIAAFENSFNTPHRGAAVSVSSSQNDSGATSQGTGAAGSAQAVGRGEVPPSLEP